MFDDDGTPELLITELAESDEAADEARTLAVKCPWEDNKVWDNVVGLTVKPWLLGAEGLLDENSKVDPPCKGNEMGLTMAELEVKGGGELGATELCPGELGAVDS